MIHRFQKIWLAFNETERQYAIGLTAVFCVALIGIIWIFVLTATVETAARGGTFRIGLIGQPTSLNPLLANGQAEKDLSHLLFSPLSELTETIQPTKKSDGWTIRLKENLIWHDGEPVTSDDIVFTIEEIQDPSTHSPLFPFWQGVKAERLSEREIKITAPARSAPLLFENYIKNLLFIPKHIFVSIPPQNWSLSDYNLKPIGNGPYRFQKLVLQNDGFLDSYTFSSFAQGSTEHAPYIQTIVVRFFKDKEEAETAFRYGTIDGLGGLDPYEAKSINRPSNVVLYDSPGYYAVFLNQSQNEILHDRNIRQALSLAVPRNELLGTVLNNYGKAMTGPSNSTHTQTTSSISDLLAASGWVVNSIGKLERTEAGESVQPKTLELTVPDLPFLEHTAQILKTAWEKIGFSVTIKLLPQKTVIEEIVPRRDYQMLLFGNIPQPREDLYPFWHSSQVFHPGLNLSLYKNSDLDSLLQRMRLTTSTGERATIANSINNTLENTQPAIFLYSPSYVYLTTKSLHGIEATSTFLFPEDRFLDIENWYIRTKRVLK